METQRYMETLRMSKVTRGEYENSKKYGNSRGECGNSKEYGNSKGKYRDQGVEYGNSRECGDAEEDENSVTCMCVLGGCQLLFIVWSRARAGDGR